MLRLVLHYNPAAPEQLTRSRKYVLHIACANTAITAAAVTSLLDCSLTAVGVPDDSGWTPLHHLCRNRGVSRDVLDAFLACCAASRARAAGPRTAATQARPPSQQQQQQRSGVFPPSLASSVWEGASVSAKGSATQWFNTRLSFRAAEGPGGASDAAAEGDAEGAEGRVSVEGEGYSLWKGKKMARGGGRGRVHREGDVNTAHHPTRRHAA